MVLDLKAPHDTSLEALQPLIPIFLSYLISFVFIGIYWNNHHHMFQLVNQINGKILWANLHLLFWLSLIPFVTSWMGETHFTSWPVAIYGIVLFMSGLAYYILERILISNHSKSSNIVRAFGADVKGILSQVIYLAGIGVSFFYSRAAYIFYIAVAIMWLIPDQRAEKVIEK